MFTFELRLLTENSFLVLDAARLDNPFDCDRFNHQQPKMVRLWLIVVFVHSGNSISKVFLKVVHGIRERRRRKCVT